MLQEVISDTSKLRDFALFIKENLLDKFVEEYLEVVDLLRLPIAKILPHVKEEQLYDYIKHISENVLNQFIEGKALEGAISQINLWKENKFPGMDRDAIKGTDIVLIYSARKQVFIRLLPLYTQDVAQIMAIVNELENFYLKMQQCAFDIYVQLQKEELQKQKEFSESLIEHSVDGIFAFDEELKVTVWNKVMEQQNGISKEEALGKKVLDIIPGYTSTEEGSDIYKVLKGETIKLRDKPFKSGKGYYDTIVVPFRQNNTLIGGISFIHDITNRKETELKLKEFQEELVANNEELKESQEELIAANEEILESHHLLQETNENLNFQLETITRMQQALAESESRFRLLAENSTDIISTYNPFNKCTYVSPAAEKLLGYTFEEIAARESAYFVHEEDMPSVRAHYEKAIETNKPQTFVYRFRHKAGGYVWLESTLQCIKDPVTSVIQEFQLATRDISARIAMEETLEKERRYLLSTLENITDGIIACDENGNIVFYNKAAQVYLGLPDELPADKVISRYYDIYHFDGRTPLEKEDMPLERACRGEELINVETVIVPKNAKQRFVTISGAQIIDRKGDGLGALIVMHDITDAKEAEFKLKEYQEELQTANEELKENLDQLVIAEERLRSLNLELEKKVKERTRELILKNEELYTTNQALMKTNTDLDNFIYTASHDLKSPILNLEGLIMMLERKMPQDADDTFRNIVRMINQAVQKFKKTLGNLTEITKAQKNQEASAEDISFAEVYEDAIADIMPLIEEAKADILTDFAVPTIQYAPANLKSIIYNLVSNAIKYRSPERTPIIKVQTRQENDFICLSVSDNGLGLDENQQHKLFKMFQRLHTHVEGSGVGLYIIKRIIENQGGRIEVESRPGEGTTFRVYFRKQLIEEVQSM